MALQILVWNCRGLKDKKGELERNLRNLNIDIAIVMEIKMKGGNPPKLRGYDTINSVRRYGAIAAGGIAIFIRNGTIYNSVNIPGNYASIMECAAINIKAAGRDICVIGVYRRPGANSRPGVWKDLIEKCGGNNTSEVIIAGDFNAHHMTWNCDRTDSNGDKLSDEMEEKGMIIINDRSKSRIGEGVGADSNLDLLFASENIADKFNYRQHEDPWGSDHFPILLSFNEPPQLYIKKTNRCSTIRTDWVKYERIMESETPRLSQEDYINANMEKKYVIITN